MKIVIHPKAKKILITTLSMAVIALVLLSLRSVIFPRPAVSETGSSPDAQAAVYAVAAFYTLDYTASSELWISNVCAFSTNRGCKAVRSFFAPTIQNLMETNQVQTGCSVLPIQLVEDDGDVHVWQVRVTLEHPWEGLDSLAQDVYVEVVKEQGRWLMNRILFKQEIQQLLTTTP